MTFQNCRFAYLRRFVFLLQLFQPSHYPHSPCHYPCQRRELSLPAERNYPCQPLSLLAERNHSLFRNSFFSLFSFFFFFIVRRVFVFARAALCPVASLTHLQQKISMFKIWPPPAATVGMVYISASRYIISRRVNVYKETVGRFGRIQGYLKHDIYPVISLRSRGPSSSSDLEINTHT